ncbi:MAG: SH3 domain-containing protein [Porcipelethomonas sp.]
MKNNENLPSGWGNKTDGKNPFGGNGSKPNPGFPGKKSPGKGSPYKKDSEPAGSESVPKPAEQNSKPLSYIKNNNINSNTDHAEDINNEQDIATDNMAQEETAGLPEDKTDEKPADAPKNNAEAEPAVTPENDSDKETVDTPRDEIHGESDNTSGDDNQEKTADTSGNDLQDEYDPAEYCTDIPNEALDNDEPLYDEERDKIYENTSDNGTESETVVQDNDSDSTSAEAPPAADNWASKKKAQKKENIVKGIENKKSFRERIDKFGRKRFIIIVSSIGSVVVLSIVMVALTFGFHIWGNHDWLPATCEEPQTCDGCGATEGEPLGHEWKEATCTDAKVCTVCGKESGVPLGHQWEEATCVKARTCSVCGEVDGEPLGHDWSELRDCEKPQQCSRCGEKTEKSEHDWVPATCEEPKTCSVCGKTSGKAKGHDWEAANCQSPKTCKNCGKTEGKIGTHVWKAATLTEPKTCTVCGKTEGSKLNYYSRGLGIIITDEASGLNLRKEPDKNSDKITGMSETAPVMVYDCNLPNWYYVEYNGKYGYASSEFITLISETYYIGYTSCKLEKVISADIDNDKTFEAVAFYTDDVVVVYEKNGKTYDYQGDSYYGYEYHLVKDKNTGSVYLGCEGDYGREEYECTLSKVYPSSSYKVMAQFDAYTTGKTRAKYDEYLNKVVFVDEVCYSGDSYNYGHWLDYTFTVN